jgi:hypothetical protein
MHRTLKDNISTKRFEPGVATFAGDCEFKPRDPTKYTHQSLVI